MRKRFFKKLLYSTIITAAFCLASLPISVCADSDGDPEDPAQMVFITVNGRWEEQRKDQLLQRINEIRMEACEEGVMDPRDGDALTVEDYVPVQWSGAMEEIARTRAAEATVLQSHTRPNGESCFTVTAEITVAGETEAGLGSGTDSGSMSELETGPIFMSGSETDSESISELETDPESSSESGTDLESTSSGAQGITEVSYEISADMETLAWGYETAQESIEGWYSEKASYINADGGEAGHYIALINPDNRYFGAADFAAYGQRDACAGEFSQRADAGSASPTERADAGSTMSFGSEKTGSTQAASGEDAEAPSTEETGKRTGGKASEELDGTGMVEMQIEVSAEKLPEIYSQTVQVAAERIVYNAKGVLCTR